MIKVANMLVAAGLLGLAPCGSATAAGKKKPAAPPPEDSEFPSEDEELEALQPAEPKPEAKPTRGPMSFGLSAGSPEVVGLFGRYDFGKRFGLRFGASPPIAVSTKIEVPALTVAANANYKLMTEATVANLAIQYGPQLALDGIVSFTDHWFGFVGLGYRRVTAVVSGSSPLRACKTSVADCSTQPRDGGSADSGTIDLYLTGTVTSTSILGRLGTGYEWRPTPRSTISLTALGLSTPLSTRRSVALEADVDSNFGPILQAFVDKAVDVMVERQQEELEEEVLAEVTPYDSRPLPIISVAFGYSI